MYKSSCSSKTFLCGEYVVTQGEPALVFSTKPRFELKVGQGHKKLSELFHKDSPAGKLLSSSHFEDAPASFVDPHQGQGGMGGSTAEFLLVFDYLQFCSDKKTEVKALWDSYRDFSQQASAEIQPSGADLCAQFMGHLSFFKSEPFYVEADPWCFPQLDFFLIRTGVKLSTHDHLNEVSTKDFSKLSSANQSVVNAVKRGRVDEFLAGIDEFASKLAEMKLTAEHSLKMLERLKAWPETKSAKACGAMGADFVVLFCQKQDSAKVLESLNLSGMPVVATASDLDWGLVRDID